MRVIALIEKPDIIEPILKYLDRWRISYRPVYRANVRSGSATAPRDSTIPTAAIGGEAARLIAEKLSSEGEKMDKSKHATKKAQLI
jgi:hypothetical protein